MASDITWQDDGIAPNTQLAADASALDTAIEQARAQLDAMTQAASVADTAGDVNADYSLHEVAGVGRYAIPRFSGWRPLLAVIHDLSANIDFSANSYPVFDAVLAEHLSMSSLHDPLDEGYEAKRNLRDNIAAVRNFLMETYYANTPEGMTPEKAKQALEEIAAFVGDGLYNNWRVTMLDIPVVPYHNPTKPFISLSEASAPGGAGAQYIYEKILEMQRQSSWLRPFTAVLELFGGKHSMDWMLPPSSMTGFSALFENDLAPTQVSGAPTAEEIAAALANVEMLEAKRAALRDAIQVNAAAADLDAIGNQLIFTADNMENVATLSEPVRRDAVDIAMDILRKLKISIGDFKLLDGLNLKPTDDLATLGAIKGVAMVYEKLLAWGKGIDGSIMQHPSIQAATRAIGQLGYLAKIEALRMAHVAGNTTLVSQLTEQLSRLNPIYTTASDTTFGGLLDKIEHGINTVLNRVQTISGPGAMVGHSAANELGSYMNAAPIAGMAMQLGADGVQNRDAVGKRNAEVLAAEAIETERIRSLNAARARDRGETAPTQPRGRQTVQQARAAQPRATTSSTPATPPAAMTAAQRQNMLRTNALRATQAHDAEEKAHHDAQVQHQQVMQQALRNLNLKQIQKSVSTAGITNAPVTTGRQAYDKMMAARAGPQAAKPAPAKPDDKNLYGPTPPKGNGRGI